MRKRFFDAFLAFWMLVLISPLLLLIVFAIRVDSRGPALFRQVRVGRNRRPFVIWKFRTMRHESGKVLDIVVKDDPRVTRVGRVLRSTHLDELPQLYNILRGEMSFVGPRPTTQAILDFYEDRYPEVRARIEQRYLVRPGLTGLSQMCDRPNSWSDDLWMERLRLDLEYLRRQSFTGDVAILVRTIPRVMRARGV